MNGILIIFLLIFFSGLIAYLGDQIGMKVGKKRISLFGLRPRYSSIIITVLTGVLIAALSITILLFTYSSLRQALFNINQVLNRLEKLNNQLTLKDKELKDMKIEIGDKVKELASLQKQKDSLSEKLSSTQQEFEKAKKSLQQAKNDINRLEKSRKDLQAKVSDLNNQREKLESKINDLNDKLSTVTDNYQQAKEMANRFQASMFYYMGEDIVYQKGDVIYSDVLEGGLSESQTIDNLNLFLKDANKVAKNQPIKINKDTGMALKLRTDDILNVAKIIYNMEKGQKVIVSLVAGVNVPKNEWLQANFMLNKDFIVFKKDQMISSKIIDANQPTSRIESELENLLETINQKAINSGLLPDNQGQVGSLDFSQFYSILNEIKDMKGQIEVEVYAGEDIWRENRLSSNLKFNVKEKKGVE